MNAGQLRWMIEFLRHEGEQQELRRCLQIGSYFKGGRVPHVQVHPIQITSVNHSVLMDLARAQNAVLKRKFLR